jgi:hypothetical protein
VTRAARDARLRFDHGAWVDRRRFLQRLPAGAAPVRMARSVMPAKAGIHFEV